MTIKSHKCNNFHRLKLKNTSTATTAMIITETIIITTATITITTIKTVVILLEKKNLKLESKAFKLQDIGGFGLTLEFIFSPSNALQLKYVGS